MKLRNSRDIARLLAITAVAVAFFMLVGSTRAFAFTSSDADTAVSAYLTAFVATRGTTAFIKGDQIGGNPGFWQEIEEIEGIEDANDRAHGALNSQVEALLNGFIRVHGTNWSYNGFNDDISWATIAFTRGFQATGDVNLLLIAKQNFDMMYARAWNPAEGALYWTTDNKSFNSCIECPAGIASYLLSRALHNSGYLTYAQTLYTWEKANLFNATSGAIYDSVGKSGWVSRWSSTYNQGTFVGLADFLGDAANAKLAADYTMTQMGNMSPSGYRIMPEYGSGGGNNDGFNSIGLRWISRFMNDQGLQKDYMGWMQANADAAWNVRRLPDNLSWCQWLHPTSVGVLHSWDCINSVVALQVIPPDGSASTP